MSGVCKYACEQVMRAGTCVTNAILGIFFLPRKRRFLVLDLALSLHFSPFRPCSRSPFCPRLRPRPLSLVLALALSLAPHPFAYHPPRPRPRPRLPSRPPLAYKLLRPRPRPLCVSSGLSPFLPLSVRPLRHAVPGQTPLC